MCDELVMDSSEGTVWDRGIFPLQRSMQIEEGQTVRVQWKVRDNKLRLQMVGWILGVVFFQRNDSARHNV